MATAVNPKKIAVYSIAKDEQKHVHRFMDSVRDADVVVVGVDPGDTTGDMLKDRGATVVRVDLPQFRFDKYRNAVLSQLPDDIDICISLDLDEVLQEGWYDIVQAAWDEKTTRLHYKLQYDSESDHWFTYDRIHHRHGYEWRHANHEALYALRGRKEIVKQCDLTVTQYQDTTKDRSKSLGLLQLATSEEPEVTRNWWYLGREYLSLGHYKSAIEAFEAYLRLRPTWEIEMCWAYIFMSQAYDRLGKDVIVEMCLQCAARSCPSSRDGYFEHAILHLMEGRYEEALKKWSTARLIDKNVHSFMHTNGAHGKQFWQVGFEIYSGLGDKERAENCHQMLWRNEG